MLEDPSHRNVVRWADDGESFVVLENEKFTKSILPKHFKHSNFASFVRQLNKYDFHKVRQSNEEGSAAAYGTNAWEFKHPEFRANSKDSLDNIRRKAPAPRKSSNNLTDEPIPIQQIDLMNQQITAQAQQIETLTANVLQARHDNQALLQELINSRKLLFHHDAVIQDFMRYLQTVDQNQRRDSKHLFPQDTNQTGATLTPTSQIMPTNDDEPASPLQHAQKLLTEMHTENFAITNLEQLQQATTVSPPVDPHFATPTAVRSATSAPPSATMPFTKTNGDLDQVVYPRGATNGIDPMYSDHIHNIPYAMPVKEIDVSDPRNQYADGRKKSNQPDPGWIRPPRILLVEDDPTCRQIGGKFLYSFCCVVDTALDGLEAVSKVQEGVKYDMILMDIIMPSLDGVSACHIIRQFDQQTPIVAMTSNIRSDDIQMYFQHGMHDVLPKPFTRKSLLEMLEKHLMHLKKLPSGMDPPHSAVSHPSTVQSTNHSVRDDLSAANSPSVSTGTWNSPSQYSNISPIGPNVNHFGVMTTSGGYVDTNSIASYGPTTPVGARPIMPAHQHRRAASDMTGGATDGGSGKKQRIYPPPAMSTSMSGRT